MLDMSCAFDTVDYELLMTRLEHSFGIADKALAWQQSYISERYHKVAVGNAESVDSILTCGVPKGSVLGPTLYCMYTKHIGDIVVRHGMQYHCFADDTQIYLTVERDESIVAALKKVEMCTERNLRRSSSPSEATGQSVSRRIYYSSRSSNSIFIVYTQFGCAI